jgi:Na+-driven multidrug efflux pump
MVGVSVPTTSMSFIKRCFPLGFRDEALTLIKITVPFAMGNVLASWLITFISLAFIGHAHGQLELNACALALSTYILIGNALMIGLNFGCDTLLPQCFGGNKHKMGLTVQRAVIITGYSCLISWTLMLNAVINYLDIRIYFKNTKNSYKYFFFV